MSIYRTIAALSVAAGLTTGTATALDLPTRLSGTAWPTQHRDFRNSDYTPMPATPELEVAWTALDGYSIITAPTIGPDGTLYVATGKEGSGNLHAFTRYGRRLWTHPDIDSKALTSSPVIDERGVIYLTDKDQLWAINPDGSTRWVNLVPAPFGTALLLGSNSVGGITIRGHVLLFNRDLGTLNAPPIKLDGIAPEIPTNLLEVWNGLVDPAIIDTIIAGLLGYGSLVANTPAIHPNGKLVIIATGDGFLYGINMEPGSIQVVYKVPIGEGSGTSPVISADGNNVYFCDGEGFLHCHDPLTGAIKYRLFTGRTYASPSVDEQGVVYVAGSDTIYAIRNGVVLWRNNLKALARQLVRPAIHNGRLLIPRNQPSSVLSVTPRHVFFQTDIGHPFDVATGGQITTPRWTGLIVLDRATGRLATPPLPLRDTGGAVVTINADGRVYCPHGSITTSLAKQLLNPILPRSRRFSEPPGGLTALRPRNPSSLMREQLSVATRWLSDIVRHIDATDYPAADLLRDQTTTLLRGTTLVLSDAVTKKQVAIPDAVRINHLMTAAEQELAGFELPRDAGNLRAAAQRHRLALGGIGSTR
ncbi:MAG TPA: PQQ-binding-like beta-propeller repeat protein [Kiritimatiellia bacterium]|nr:PQQ-binding-like beta-propeller repeat protein [Kiritimatiellia bacterium]HMP33618.1 PQQ-binding-like beta-propeller repeat protein [Kiritimatiellia bacterium]